eukprot:jgi/Mesen1/8798/ME000528S08188
MELAVRDAASSEALCVHLKADSSRDVVDMSHDWDNPALPPVYDDEPAVRAYLLEALTRSRQDDAMSATSAEEAALATWRPLMESGRLEWAYVARLLAEARLLSGQGNAREWFGLLQSATSGSSDNGAGGGGRRIAAPDESVAERLVARVDIAFAPSNPRVWAPQEEVCLDVFLKNVPSLTVKVFEVNAWNYLRDNADADAVPCHLDLDGLTAGHEEVLTWQANGHATAPAALLRTRRTIRLRHLAGRRGCFIVELVGNGRCSRAAIHKGRIRYLERRSAAGHAFTLVREDGLTPVGESARVWVDGKEYTPAPAVAAGAGHEIVVPYGATCQRTRILLSDGELTCVDYYEQKAES